MTITSREPKPLKLCLILSSIGGPRMLTPLFSGALKEDVAYIVIQRSAGLGLLDILVECLREEVNRPTFIAGHSLQLQGGAIHFLPNERNYAIQGNKLIAAELPGNGRLNLDHLFQSILKNKISCSIVVLSGMLTDEDGLEGIAKLKEAGIQILGTLESHTPVFDLIDQLRNRDLIGELFPPKYLFEHLHFNSLDESEKGNAKKPKPTPKILVADDEEKVRTYLLDMLQSHGFLADSAVDGIDALRKLQKGHYAGLILDLQMPEMDGLKTLEALKTIDPKLPIVVMTGLEDSAKIQSAKSFNVLGVLQKPFTWEKLKKLLPPLD